MVRISRRGIKVGEEGRGGRYVRLGRIDRSRYPKPTFWIIFAAAGALILWLVARFFFFLAR